MRLDSRSKSCPGSKGQLKQEGNKGWESFCQMFGSSPDQYEVAVHRNFRGSETKKQLEAAIVRKYIEEGSIVF